MKFFRNIITSTKEVFIAVCLSATNEPNILKRGEKVVCALRKNSFTFECESFKGMNTGISFPFNIARYRMLAMAEICALRVPSYLYKYLPACIVLVCVSFSNLKDRFFLCFIHRLSDKTSLGLKLKQSKP